MFLSDPLLFHRLVDVIEEGFDAVVRTGIPTDSRLKASKLGTFKQLLVASPAYLMQRGTPTVPTDLLEHACLHYRFSHSGKLEKWPLKKTADEADLQLPISMICNNIETRVCFALKGRGIACLPDLSITTWLDNQQLIQVLPEFVDTTGVFYILWPATKHPSPKVRALVNFLSQRMFERSDV